MMQEAHFCSMCGPRFCSMAISTELQEYAKKNEINAEEAASVGMAEMSEIFKRTGAELYHEDGPM